MSRTLTTQDGTMLVRGEPLRIVLDKPHQRPAAQDAQWEESKHKRAKNGQFGSGGTAHIVTTHDGETATFHHVGTTAAGANKAHSDVEDDEDVEDVPEYHTPKIEGGAGERGDAVHIVHSSDGDGGTDVHGAFLNYGRARQIAHEASQSEWEQHGPTYADAGLNDLETTDLATAWNDEHAGDHHDVQVKVDADGDPVLDDDGGFQFVQDGVDVEPTDDMVAAFDDLREEMYPEDERAAFPGLDEANDHFEAEGRHEAVFKIHSHGAPARGTASDAAPRKALRRSSTAGTRRPARSGTANDARPRPQEGHRSMPRSAYPIAMDAAPQDGRWLDDPGAVKTVLQFLLSKLPPDQLAELDTHLTEGTTPQAQDHRIPEGEFKRGFLNQTPRNRRTILDSLASVRRHGAPMTMDEMLKADPDHGKSLLERFPNMARLRD